MNKTDLLGFILKRQNEIELVWAGATPAQMVKRPGVTRDWSVKDLIVHLTYWENRVLADIRLAIAGKTPVVVKDVDFVNDRAWRLNRDRPLADVIADFQQAHEAVLDCLETIPESLLDTQQFPWAEGGTLLTHLLGEYQTHYDAHLPDLCRWRAGLVKRAERYVEDDTDAYERYW